MRSFIAVTILALAAAPAYGDLFVQTVGDADAMVNETFTQFDAERNLDCFVFSPDSDEPAYLSNPQVNVNGWIEWEFTFDPGVPVAAINGATVGIYAWDVDWMDYEVVTIGNDTVSYVLGGLEHLSQGWNADFAYGTKTGEPECGTLVPQLSTFTLTAEQASSLFGDSPSASVRIDFPEPNHALAVDYATITIDYTPPVSTPEPATVLMLGALGAGLAGASKLRRKK